MSMVLPTSIFLVTSSKMRTQIALHSSSCSLSLLSNIRHFNSSCQTAKPCISYLVLHLAPTAPCFLPKTQQHPHRHSFCSTDFVKKFQFLRYADTRVLNPSYSSSWLLSNSFILVILHHIQSYFRTILNFKHFAPVLETKWAKWWEEQTGNKDDYSLVVIRHFNQIIHCSLSLYLEFMHFHLHI